MNFRPEIKIIQNQKTALTPKMVEELKVLQMSYIDLMQFIDVQLDENPLLEIESDNVEETELPDIDTGKEYIDGIGYEEQIQKQDFTVYTSKPLTLRQHLQLQVRELRISPEIRKIVFYLVETVTEDGYLGTSISDASLILNVPMEQVKKAIKVVHRLEPAGIGARNLKECILLQLKQKRQLNDAITAVIKDYLELLAEKKYKTIADRLGLTIEQVEDIHKKIKYTDPKPGLKFSGNTNLAYIKPELTVKFFNNKFIVLFSNEAILNLKVSEYYRKLIKSDESSCETRKYIKSKALKAKKIINAVEQRKITILNVADCIIEYQDEFLRKGYMFLRPLTLKTVAEKVGLHESTISRTVNEKFIETPRGIFELKFFLSSQVDTEGNKGNTGIAANAVKKAIRDIIKTEDRKNPLNDEKIKKILEKDGIRVARRTVAKYREGLSIMPARIRKALTKFA